MSLLQLKQLEFYKKLISFLFYQKQGQEINKTIIKKIKIFSCYLCNTQTTKIPFQQSYYHQIKKKNHLKKNKYLCT